MPESAAPSILTTELTHPAPNVVVVLCHGRLVWGSNDLFYTTVRPLLSANKRVILDLSELKHTDSIGLGTLVRLYVASKSEGCNLELINLSKQIRYLLGLTHLFDVFTVIGENGVKFM